MKRSVEIHIGASAQRVGTLHYNQDGKRESSAFEYHSAWLKSASPFPIEPAMRLLSGPQFYKSLKDGSKFTGAVADTEPDGWGRRVILRDYAKRRERMKTTGGPDLPPPNGLDFLLAVDDMSRMGALRFMESGIWLASPETGRRATPPVVELPDLFAATRAVECQTETEADLAYLLGRGTSLGGLRPKCTILDSQGQLSIGKFPSVQDTRAVTKGEILALRLAAAAGINTAQGELLECEGVPIAMIKRFDRSKDGARIPYISAATMLGAETSDGNIHTYAEIVDSLRMHGAAAQEDIDELWRRIAFSILITNVDDHLHNHGFLHATGTLWRLAPAFDINPFPERHRELKTWISEETGPNASVAALWSVLPYFRINQIRAKTILREVAAAVAKWRQVGRAEAGMTNKELDAFADAFEHSERDAAKSYLTA